MFPRLWATSLFHVKHDRTVCGCRCPNCRRASLRKRWRDFCGWAHPARSEFAHAGSGTGGQPRSLMTGAAFTGGHCRFVAGIFFSLR